MREALKVVDAMAPCVLFIDEIEKGLAGVGGSSTDDGTTQRVGGTFLTWLNDHTSEVFVIATCNDYSKLPLEYTRMGRWDSIWFVDNPAVKEQLDILDIYLKQQFINYGVLFRFICGHLRLLSIKSLYHKITNYTVIYIPLVART